MINASMDWPSNNEGFFVFTDSAIAQTALKVAACLMEDLRKANIPFLAFRGQIADASTEGLRASWQ